jgi:uridine kinase
MQVFLVAIDGDAAAGKTTLAGNLAEKMGAMGTVNVIPMDHFFLPKELRTKSRLAEPGGNVHYERFKSEILIPLLAGRPFAYRPFDCAVMDFGEEIFITPTEFTIIEGSYAHHPAVSKAYTLKIFLEIDPETQMNRIKTRNGPVMAEKFQNIWIPMEKAYQAAFNIKQNSNLSLKQTDL